MHINVLPQGPTSSNCFTLEMCKKVSTFYVIFGVLVLAFRDLMPWRWPGSFDHITVDKEGRDIILELAQCIICNLFGNNKAQM